MIIDFFIDLFNSIINLLPSLDLHWLEFGYSTLLEYLSKVNYYFPVTELFYFIVLIAAFYLFRFIFNIVKWVASRIVV